MILQGTVVSKVDGQPLMGIPVSDGRHIVLTDENGAFSMEAWDGAHILNVNVLTYGHNDWFFPIDGRSEYRFVIDKMDIGSDFCFLHMSDTEIINRRVVDWTDFVIDTVRREKPAFFIHTGDIARDEIPRHALLLNSEVLHCPVRYTIGNHDVYGDGYGEKLYESVYGPTWYSFDCGDIHFVALSLGWGDVPSGYALEDEWIWLERDLALMDPSKKIIILDHDHASDETTSVQTVGDRIIDLKQNGLLAWVFGHYHSNYLLEYSGVCNICSSRPDSGGIDSAEAGVRKISLTGHTLSSEMLYNTYPLPPCDTHIWQTKLLGRVGYCTPLPIGDTVVVGTFDDGYPKQCGLYCLDRHTGAILWQKDSDAGFRNEFSTADGLLYAEDCKGRIFCLNAENGDEIWQYALPLLPDKNYAMSNTLVVEDLLIAGKQQHVVALNRHTGQLVWEYKPSYSATAPSRFVYDPYRRQVLLSAHWYGLIALDIADGTMNWETKDLPVWFRSETPLVTETRIFAAGESGIGSLDPVTGKVLQHVTDKSVRFGVCGAPIQSGNTVYYPTATHGVIAVDADTLNIKRFFPAKTAAVFTSPYQYGDIQTVESTPILKGNVLLFTASDGYVWQYDIKTGAVINTVCIGAPSLVSPLLSENDMIVADFSGCITKFKR
ncbi:MAG: PQQ-binding-like beta-propeller repeat protein [Clostridia bacterium]|nr:PQQ-binding-like beta-propeller repeat protein [Clostridia bacterium]